MNMGWVNGDLADEQLDERVRSVRHQIWSTNDGGGREDERWSLRARLMDIGERNQSHVR